MVIQITHRLSIKKLKILCLWNNMHSLWLDQSIASKKPNRRKSQYERKKFKIRHQDFVIELTVYLLENVIQNGIGYIAIFVVTKFILMTLVVLGETKTMSYSGRTIYTNWTSQQANFSYVYKSFLKPSCSQRLIFI